MSCEGDTCAGSGFDNTFDGRQTGVYGTAETDTFTRGDMTMADGRLTVNHTDSIEQDGDPYSVGLLQLINGGLYTQDKTPAGEQWNVGLSGGSLNLMHTTADGVVTTGVVDASWMSMLNRCGTVLWQGASTMNAKQTITPSIRLDACLNGWALIWGAYNPSTQKVDNSRFNISFITKYYAQMFSGDGISMPIYDVNFGAGYKYIYTNNQTLSGNDVNASDTSAKYVCRAVVAW